MVLAALELGREDHEWFLSFSPFYYLFIYLFIFLVVVANLFSILNYFFFFYFKLFLKDALFL